MSTGPMLPLNVRKALHEEVKRLVDKIGVSQTEIAHRLGFKQPTISKLYRGPDVGVEVAEAFFRVYGSREELLTRHRMRDPAPETDMLVREFYDWVEGMPAVKAVSRRPDVTVKDLLRLKKTPPRGGDADPEVVYSHILQLRVGEIGGVPSHDPPSLEGTMRRRYAKKDRSR